MRSTFSFLFIAGIMLAPLAASAQGFQGLAVNQAGPTVATKCPKGASTGDPSGTESFTSSQIQNLKSYLNRTIYCANACYNVTIRISVSKNASITFITTAENMCTDKQKLPAEQNPPRGCAKNQTQPQVTAHTPAVQKLGFTLVETEKIGPKSRCDTSISDIVSSMTSRSEANDLDGYKSDLARLAGLPSPSEGTPQARTLDPSQYRGVLEAYGLTQTEANLAIANNPEAVEKLAACLSTGCSQEEFKKASTEIAAEVSPETKEKISRLQAEVETGRSSGVYPTDPRFGSGAFTGASDLDRAKQAISCIESSCGRYDLIGPPTRNGDRAFGKYQVMGANVPSWTYRACGQAMDPYTYLADTACQEKVFETVYGGYVSSCGSYEAAASKWFSGRCQITNSNDGYLSVSGYVQKFSRYFAGSTLPFGSTASVYTRSAAYGASPFGSVNPFTYNTPYGTEIYSSEGRPIGYFGPGGFVSAPPPPPIQQPVQQQPAPQPTPQPGQQTPPVQPVPNPVPPTPPPAVSAIIAQPSTVVRGESIAISWSSVGMRKDVPCQLYVGTQFIAQGNEGTRTFETKPVLTNSVTFTLKCATIGGQITERSATVPIR